jgi:hypothetical protein
VSMAITRPLVYDFDNNIFREGAAVSSNGGVALQVSRNMEYGVLTYALPSVPPDTGFLLFVNGVQTSCTVEGDTITLTEYTPGEIEDTDFLTIYY